ncbi:MAG: phosphopyruvate hydratase [Clostridiales bacterium]|jgi:enolase|nr:phosphopyruvate hydratase [Clostridiales bacterium]
MKDYIAIDGVYAREILDSRGNPTVEVEVCVDGGTIGRASVPSGASKGAYEAIELRDEDNRYHGQGVETAVNNVNEEIADAVIDMNVLDQIAIDRTLIDLDGTPNKARLGANAVLGVSLACARAAAASLGMPLYQYIGGTNAKILPMPMMNILNGGAHADNSVDTQEFMIMPISASSFSQALRMCSEVFHSLKGVLKQRGLSTGVGDEGGFAPNLSSDNEVLDTILQAITNAGYTTPNDFRIAIDAAVSGWYNSASGDYRLPKSNRTFTRQQMIDHWVDLVGKYPIASIEDVMAEDDWEGWKQITERLGDKTQIVGDDLFVTNTQRLSKGIAMNAANSILIKVNQIGTLTETLDAISTAHRAGYTTVISHRSGETEDSIIADLSVAVNAGQIKTGAPSRSERVAKYNQLLRIEEELGDSSQFLGANTFKPTTSEVCLFATIK